MSDEQAEASATEATPELAESFLDRAIAATGQTAPDTTRNLLATLTRQALEGTVVWSKNLTKTIEEAVAALDDKISRQLSEVLHQEGFQQLEGSWRGLNKLIRNSDLGSRLKVRVLDITRDELLEQFEEAPAIDRSRLFNMVYQHEFGTAGGGTLRCPAG
ncbi:type VI secretion system contractile sheath domain-containing protein [Endozoicomonas sp. GU-1]|uniref:type VI secretion system contractile sheath domain-containing protein n=1 Tax=Endozoicomonas sp. GU-1 TaxID=3009078 RepID=UPI002FC3123B